VRPKVEREAGVTTPVISPRRRVPPQLRVVQGGRDHGTATVSNHGDDDGRDATVRWERVHSARARISTGYYDRTEVREHVSTAVLEQNDEI